LLNISDSLGTGAFNVTPKLSKEILNGNSYVETMKIYPRYD
jgi:hypothetical protein